MKTVTKPASLPRLFIVDDHPMMRLGLAKFIAHGAEFQVCGEAADTEAALAGIQRTQPDLLLLDISLNGRSGLELLHDIKERFPALPVLVHSMHDEAIYAERSLAAGAKGYLMKHETGPKLLAALRQVLAGKVFLSERLRAHTAAPKAGEPAPAHTPLDSLTPREFEILRLIGQGAPNRELAQQLRISLKTVEAHREHIKQKLGLTSSTALNLFAVRWASEHPV